MRGRMSIIKSIIWLNLKPDVSVLDYKRALVAERLFERAVSKINFKTLENVFIRGQKCGRLPPPDIVHIANCGVMVTENKFIRNKNLNKGNESKIL